MEAFVDLVCGRFVPAEADDRELSLDHAWIYGPWSTPMTLRKYQAMYQAESP